MTQALARYKAYKDSGVEWLGEVPMHWEVKQMGRIGRFFKGGGGTKEDDIKDGVSCVRYGDLYMHHEFSITESRACVAPEVAMAAYTPLRYGDVLFAGSGETIDEIGKSGVNLIRGQAYCGGDVIIFRPHINVDARFFGYATGCPQAAYQKARMGRGITVMHIYASELKYMFAALPPISEQTAIARFLDHIGSRIDRYIHAKERMIALLEEQKQVTINDAVTGRVDVRTGQPYRAYKDSGVEWLGEVPTHWDMVPNRAVFTELKKIGHSDEQMLSVTISNGVIRQTELLQYDSKKDQSRMDKSAYKLVEPGDIAYNKMRAWQGAIGASRHRGIASPAYVVWRPSVFVNTSYMHRLFRTPAFAKEAERHSYGIASDMWSLRAADFKTIHVCQPPLVEQTAIARFLDKATASTDSAIARSRCQIQLMREYRTRLIADVVTGKLDVREAAEALPEEPGADSLIRNKSEQDAAS